jgi:hypothetical protein
MSMTKKTTTTWTTPPVSEEFDAVRTDFVQAALDAGKTDSLTATLVPELENVFERNWIDTAAANEWISFLNTQAAAHSLSQTTTTTNI